MAKTLQHYTTPVTRTEWNMSAKIHRTSFSYPVGRGDPLEYLAGLAALAVAVSLSSPPWQGLSIS